MFKVLFRVQLYLTKRQVQQRAQSLSRQLRTSPYDAHLYLAKAVNLALQAKMLVGTGPPKQPPVRNFNDLATALVEAANWNDALYQAVGSLLAQAAEAAFTALELGRSQLVDPPVEDTWRDWKRTTIERCQQVLGTPYTSTEGYYRALRWLTGTLSQNPLDADLCLCAARMMAHTSHNEEAVPFFLLLLSLRTYRSFTGLQKSDWNSAIHVAEKVLQKEGSNQTRGNLLRGVIFLFQGDFQGADAAIKRAMDLDTETASPFRQISTLYRARVLDSLGKTSEANDLRATTSQLLHYRS